MKRFVWRLQRVLDVKTKEEQIKKTELLRLTEKLTGTRSKLLGQKRILEEIIHELKTKQVSERLNEQELFFKHSATTNERVKTLQAKIKELEDLQSAKIAELMQIRKFREGLEKLRDQAKTEFIQEQEKLDQKEMDEMAAIRFARKDNAALSQSMQLEMTES